MSKRGVFRGRVEAEISDVSLCTRRVNTLHPPFTRFHQGGVLMVYAVPRRRVGRR